MRQPSMFPLFRSKFTGPMTQVEICLATGLTQATVSRFLKDMREVGDKEAYVCDWRRAKSDSGPPVAVYDLGNLPDVPCNIPTLSGKERTRNSRARAKAKSGIWGKRDFAYGPRAPKTAPPHHYLTAALFGLAA